MLLITDGIGAYWAKVGIGKTG